MSTVLNPQAVAERLGGPRPTRSLRPGLLDLPPGVELYRIKGGGSLVVPLRAGDKITVTDPEGLQPCEIAVFDDGGRSVPEALGARQAVEATGLHAVLAARSEDAGRAVAALKRRGIDLGTARVLRALDGERAPGTAESFTCDREAICIVAAPGAAMSVHEQAPPTDLTLRIDRARVEGKAPPPPVAEPLADPRVDFRIAAGTAQAYEVKAGEYIQVLDIEGRECSDFQSLDRRLLDRGIARPLDATTTRTLMGAIYPSPGLYGKYYDVDQQAQVEIIRDTVGRHDTFGLACAAKYYEDLGYPGHANCSTNFSNELEAYDVERRRGWEAINFFFNTGIDDTNALYMEEPWSRPGDYVLLRALTDLVCVSSACPCDVDPANGWQPTDIQVRVYPETDLFSKAVAFRMTPDAVPELTKQTGFNERTSALTRDFVEYNGYWIPNSYRDHGPQSEYWACREAAIVMDLSALRKFEILGPDAEALCQYGLTRNVRKLAVGEVVYSAMCYDTGGMIDDGTLLKLGADNFRWIGGSDTGGIWLRQQAEKLGLKAWVKSSTDQMHNLSVQGPKSRDILKQVIWTADTQPRLEEIGWFRFTVGRIGDHNGAPVVVSRTGYTGELGYEVWCHPRDAVAVWDAIWEAGEPHGLTPLGLAALDMLRIESGLIFAGAEFDDQTDPFEAGIGFTVPLKSKDDDFIGREALLERKAHPQRKLVGLELDGNEAATNGDCVHVGRAQVGTVTSGVRSPVLKRNVALCRMDVRYAEAGTEVEVGKLDGHSKRLPAKVVPFPFYDPKKEKPRS
ncbi:MAG: DUF1989 domain-containing protein [Rhodovibrionaceae bacterium]